MSELPPGWEGTTLGELAALVRGVSFKRQEVSSTPADGLVPIIRAGNVQDGQLNLDDDLVWVPNTRVSPDQYLRASDIVVATSSGSLSVVGKSARVHSDWIGAHGAFMAVVRPRGVVLPSFLHWWLQTETVRRSWSAASAGTNINNLKVGTLTSTPVPLPPLAEQERVVAAIEEHLSRLDAAKAGMHSAETRLSTMRASLLEEVTRGDWASRPLGKVLLSLRNGCFVSRPKTDPPGLPILRISAVRPLALDPADVRYAPESLDRAAEYEVRAGDLLFTRYSGNPDYVGACATVPPEGDGLLHPDKLIRGVPDPALALSGWIAVAASASVGRRQIEQRLKTTAGQVGISGSQLKSVSIPLPPLDEQAERLCRWEDGLEAITRLRSEIESCSMRAEGARRSILAAAFFGRLVPQDPHDEPAALLLDRIRAERATATPTRRTRKAKVS